MKEIRRIDIKNKVFTKSDILNIGKVILNEYNSAQDAGNHSSITFKIDFIDGTSYESETMGLFDEGGIIDLKKTRAIEISFHNYTLDRYINISVVHGGGYRDNLIVRGDDQNWVNGIFTRMKEIVDSIRPQDNWIIKHKSIVLHITALGIGTVIYSALWFILYRHIEPIKNPSENIKSIRAFFTASPFLSYLLDWLLNWVMGIPWAPYIRGWLLSLWPEIEFDFGPEHMKVEKIRRLRISIVFSVAVIPIILAIGYDLLKSLLVK